MTYIDATHLKMYVREGVNFRDTECSLNIEFKKTQYLMNTLYFRTEKMETTVTASQFPVCPLSYYSQQLFDWGLT